MAETSAINAAAASGNGTARRRRLLPYEQWMEAQGIPIYRGHYLEDMRTAELGWWAAREHNAAFIYFEGQEGVSEARLTEIPPGQSLRPMKMTLDEIVYVVDGRGLTTVTFEAGGPQRTFEWTKRSMFLMPRGAIHQFSNVQGDRPARLMHRNFLPVAMSLIPDPDFFFNNPRFHASVANQQQEGFYSEAKMAPGDGSHGHWVRNFWNGNFFPDMLAWDNLVPLKGRGAGGSVVWINFTGSELGAVMSVFPVGTYKKAHRHGPGRVILIPGGDGYSVLWEDHGKEKVVVPWHEGSVFSPPNRWFHQHFNTGGIPARYLRPINSSSMPQFAGRSERVEDVARDQIEYADEDPFIRQTFEAGLAKKGLKSLMPEQAYTDKDYEWDYGDEE